jgi:hypothetical protein
MELVLRLAKENIIRNTGGPFSAAIFNMENGELISVGLNRALT